MYSLELCTLQHVQHECTVVSDTVQSSMVALYTGCHLSTFHSATVVYTQVMYTYLPIQESTPSACMLTHTVQQCSLEPITLWNQQPVYIGLSYADILIILIYPCPTCSICVNRLVYTTVGHTAILPLVHACAVYSKIQVKLYICCNEKSGRRFLLPEPNTQAPEVSVGLYTLVKKDIKVKYDSLYSVMDGMQDVASERARRNLEISSIFSQNTRKCFQTIY